MEKLLHWQEIYSVQIPEIDEQHKKIIDLTNELYDAFFHHALDTKIDEVIDGLAKYAIYHFKTEETYFAKCGYTEAYEHVEQHRFFTTQVEKFSNELLTNNKTLHIEVMTFLQQWIKKHILEEDMKYVKCFKDAGL